MLQSDALLGFFHENHKFVSSFPNTAFDKPTTYRFAWRVHDAKHESYYAKVVDIIVHVSILYWKFAREIVNTSPLCRNNV